MDFNYLRRNALFKPPTPVGINPNSLSISPDMMQQGDQPDVQRPVQAPQSLTDVYREMMNAPSGPANQRYKDFLSEEQPQRENFKPSKMTRLGAILSGASAGVRGEDGYGTARNILDEPYNKAMGDYKFRASRLSEGAGLEDKEVNNKVKTYRDFVTDQYNDERIKNEQERLRQGDELTRARIKDFSNRETPEQRMARALGTARAGAEARTAGARSLFDYEEPIKQRNAKEIANLRSSNTLNNQNAKFQSIKDLKKYIADNVTKDKYTFKIDSDGTLMGINNADPTDIISTGIDTGKMTDQQKIEFGLKAKQTLKQTPGVGSSKTTTTTVDGNKRTTTSTTTPETSKPKTVHIILSDKREMDIPADKLDEAKKRDPKLVVK